MEEPIHKLKFRLIETTSEDFDFPLYELMKGMSESAGWLSSRFCTYPQEILIQFIQPVRLRQLNILINEKKIPSMIEFYYFYPQTSDDYYTNYKKLLFDKVGYVRMDTNSRTNYKARELRKVFIDLPCLYIKLVIHKNYVNKFNIFNQVGIVGLEFFGLALQPIIHNKDFYLKESVKENVVNDEDLDDLSLEKLRILKQKQEEAIKVEDYDEAKKIKKVIDRTKMIGKKIREYEDNKKIYINNEDFDNAKIMKLEIERLKSNLKYIDKQPGALVPYHNTSLEINKSEFEENKDNNYKEAKDLKENKEISINFNNDEISMDQKSFDKSIFNKTNKETNINKSLEKIQEEDFMSYDDIIIPTLLKKMNNSNNNTIQEILDEAAIKGELEELDPNIHFTYEPLAKIIGDETLRKIFSKHVLWKEEGLTEFIESLGKIFTDRDTASINSLINLILKLVYNLTCEKHPVVVVKAIDIFEKLLILIRDSKVELNYDFSISDLILVKIKEKVGDVSPKVRGRVVNLYCFMLKQQSCDYNNLLTELVEDELKPLIDTKRIVKSSKMKLGKLSIFDNVFDDFPNAIKQNRTSMQYFPFEFILRYVIENLNHSKSEVRKLDRAVLIKMYKLFGFKMLEPLLKKADERELAKLVPDIPELEEVIKSSNSLVNNSVTLTKKAVTNTSRQKSNERKRNSPSPVKMVMCNYCQKQIEKSIELQDHLNKDCLMFTQCVKCKNNMEVKTLNHHLLNQCKNKDEFKMCKRCKEPIDDKEYALHVKENKCNPAKNINSSNRCPLCHKDILPGDKGFYQHLVKDICQKNKRREKVNFLKK